MNLNLGCGDRYAEGWINVDHAGCPHRKDLTLDLTGDLPWKPQTVNSIYMGHLLEHLTVEQCFSLLGKLRVCIVPHGQLMVVGPDLVTAQRMAEEGTLDVTLDSLKHGASRWPGDEHQWECTAVAVASLLMESGWNEVNPHAIGSVNAFWPVADRGPTWQFALLARP